MMCSLRFVIPLFLMVPLFFSCSDTGKKEVNEKPGMTGRKGFKKKRKISDGLDQLTESSGNYQFVYNDTLSDYLNAYNKTLSLFELPVTERDIPTQFGNAHVLVCGKPGNPPLVLLHGMNASSTMWYPNMKALSKNYRVYAIDFLLEPGK